MCLLALSGERFLWVVRVWEEGGSSGVWLHLAPIANHSAGIPSTRTRAESEWVSWLSARLCTQRALRSPLLPGRPICVHRKKLQLSLWTQGRVLHTYLTLFLTRAQHFWNMMHFSSFYFNCFWDFAIISSWDMKDFKKKYFTEESKWKCVRRGVLSIRMFVASGLGWGGVSCSCGVVPAT